MVHGVTTAETERVVVFWFRRDLRLDDNRGLYSALSSGFRVLPLFVFDTEILSRLGNRFDRRISFILGALEQIQYDLVRAGSSLFVFHGTPEAAFQHLSEKNRLHAVYANGDYEPEAGKRDAMVGKLLSDKGIAFHLFKDQVIFEKDEIVKDDGRPYSVYTPYSRAWKKALNPAHLLPCPSRELKGNFLPAEGRHIPSAGELGFDDTGYRLTPPDADRGIISNYHLTRDIPSLEGTTRLGPHIRFGTVSIRYLVSLALELNETWLNELIWREFFMSVLWHFPHVVDGSFRRAYDGMQWLNDEDEFRRWCDGMTGYPIVDAGMRELSETGFMHNRLRMITASFLTKHLLIDWRWGEAWFAEKLTDYDLAANNGNWQWAAGCGCDAAPWFRIFSPAEQMRKFDRDMVYTRRWVPEAGSAGYPPPVVEHRYARERALRTYGAVTAGLRL